MLHDNSFQIINIYSISGHNRVSELPRHYLLMGGVDQMLIQTNSKDLLLE
jgi:hypothetical protein